MSLRYDTRQKSLKRRFLLILGLITLVCVLAMGLTLMFWKKFDFGLTPTYRYLLGGLLITYGIVRFVRIFRKDDDEE